MQPTHFRAYAAEAANSRRLLGDQKLNVTHDVHNPLVEGAVHDGKASFTAKGEIAYVAFYAGKGDEQTCAGHLDGPFGPGKVTADFADIPEEKPVDLGNGEFEQGGNVYRKAD